MSDRILHGVLDRLLPQRRLGWVWFAATWLIVANGLRLRARARTLEAISEGPPTSTARESGNADDSSESEYRVIQAAGVHIGDRTRHAALAHARAHRLDTLDLVPSDLGFERLMELVRSVDPEMYRSDPLAPGRSARQATLVHRSVLERAGQKEIDQLDSVSYLTVTEELKKCAPRSTDLAVTNSLHSADEDLSTRRAYLSALHGRGMPVFAALPGVATATLISGLLVAPGWALAALASYCAQPLLVAAGSPMRPRDLTPLGLLGRPLAVVWNTVRVLTTKAEARTAPPDVDAAGNQAVLYRELLSRGLERFFETRRDTCPLCSSNQLSVRLRTRDLFQFKPGEFELDECASCGHIFQNPRLSPEGLDFYYRDFYEGDGGALVDRVSASSGSAYQDRANMMAAHAHPAHWLDIGGGHGHFCLSASTIHPGTKFEALDMGNGILDAERRQWIDKAHVGFFLDVAPRLSGTFDALSMNHYLEHTRDPAAEIAAAADVLEEGGYFLIELPDPQCPMARMLGPLWLPWFQPQHQHLLSLDNLSRLLADGGFTIVAQERGTAHIPMDLTWALLLLLNRMAGRPSKPWLPPPRRWDRSRRGLCFVAVTPLFVPLLVVDWLIGQVIRRRPIGSNSYRILARKDGRQPVADT